MTRWFSVAVFVVFICVYCYYYYFSVYNSKRRPISTTPHQQNFYQSRTILLSDGHVSKVAGRRPDDGAWYNFSVPPALQFFAYSAFIDERTSPGPPVVRMIAMSTTFEQQRQRNVTLFCVFNYKDGRPATASRLVTDPSPIGAGYPLYGITVKEYVYACPLVYDEWPISLSISTKPGQQNLPQSSPMPVEVPIRDDVSKPLATCVQVAYGRVDPVRLVEWMEFLRLLGVSLVGVYLASDISRSTEKVLKYYADVDGLVDLRRSYYISQVVGGSATSPRQYLLHGSPVINDCIYRNMFRFSRIAVFDFDEVFLTSSSLLGYYQGRSQDFSLGGGAARRAPKARDSVVA